MAEIQQGATAVVWGAKVADSIKVNGSATAINWKIQTCNYQRTGDEVLTQDEVGETVNACSFNGRETCTLELIPHGSSKANALADSLVAGISKGMYLVIIDDGPDTDFAATSTGKAWMISDISKTRSNNDKAKISISLARFDGITSYTALS